MKRILLIAWLVALISPVISQTNVPVVGVSDERPGIYGLKNALVVTAYDQEPVKSDILIVKGRFREIGKNLDFPAGTVVIDMDGKTIYPSFVDIHSSYGLPASNVKETDPMAAFFTQGQRGPSVPVKPRTADYWNQGIKLNYNAVSEFKPDPTSADAMRRAGFGAVVTVKKDGIARGSSALVSLADDKANNVILKSQASSNYSFSRGTSEDAYPTAQYGAIALLRQMYLDGEWYDRLPDGVFYDDALEVLQAHKALPKVFEVKDKYEIPRVNAIAKEFGLKYIIKGSGNEYQLLDEIRSAGVALVIPLKFPDPPDVKDPYLAASVPLSTLKHWEMAPANAGMLSKAGIEFAVTADGLSKPGDFLGALRKAVEMGLEKEVALKAATCLPARMIGAEELVGGIQKGMVANLLVTSGDLFDKECVIYQNWVQGKPYTFVDPALVSMAGDYTLEAGDSTYTMKIKGKPDQPEVEVKSGGNEVTSAMACKNNLVTISLYTPKGMISLSGASYDGTLKGDGMMADGSWIRWSAKPVAGTADSVTREDTAGMKRSETEAPEKNSMGKVIYPFEAFGWEEKPVQVTILFRNATVWTLDRMGKSENTDVLVSGGKISAVGQNLQARGARVIDATGMHVTPGIIDEHSHIAMASTNEVGQAITSEVRVGDIIDPSDMTIYRQLSGGVTAAHILHGSANPIGGQSVLIKLRWGSSAQEMKIDGQVGFLKHALGENVKRSANRYPNTRMGVEHIIRDAYQRAGDYNDIWKKYNALSDKEKVGMIPPRRDLELDALVDVLEERSYITCHTYVQSEAMMIMELAEDFGIKAHTLIHMNEGFKLADKIREHGAAASVFADWWDYKYEVYEGINYNAATLVQQGVLTCINSDDGEMGRRLNQEAAKVVKYGGIDEIGALKLVTLNPAKILHLDQRMGSIEPGKDADIVLWSDHPLSVYARAKMTLVDGMVYFDEEKDAAMKASVDEERNRIIQKILKEGPKKPPANSTSKKPI
ncbi:MAG: amidohydrolase family protein [Bacteroidota bacterium]